MNVMYQFKPYTERVARLRDAVRDRLMVADAEKPRLQLEAKKKYIKNPPMLQKPYISLYVLERMPLNIQQDGDDIIRFLNIFARRDAQQEHSQQDKRQNLFHCF